MTDPAKDLLTTTEGVDEGSAASTVEGPYSGAAVEAGARPPVPGESPAPPVPVETDESRAAGAADTGQQLQVGEG
jgi:hypothetical protein